MTPAEIVACVERMTSNSIGLAWELEMPYAERTLLHPDEAFVLARAAFHEAAKLLDFCESARVWCECGDQVTSEGWPHGDPVLCWVCTAEHKRRIADAEAPKTCGTCAYWVDNVTIAAWAVGKFACCASQQSHCQRAVNGDGSPYPWPADHGCPQWRRKEGSR